MASRTQSRLWLGTGLGTYPIEYRKHIGRAEQPIGLVERKVGSVKEFEVALGKSDPPWVASAGCDHEAPSHDYFGDFIDGKVWQCRCSGLISASPANVGAISRGVVDSATPEFTREWPGLSVSPSESKVRAKSFSQSATRFVATKANPRLAAALPTTGLRLVAGEKIYAAQLVSPQAPLPWRVEMKLLKSSPECGVQMTICHQVLLQSCDCVVPTKQLVGEIDEDQLQKISFVLTQLPNDLAGAEEAWRRAWSPTALSFVANGDPGDAIEVYDLRVTDAVGRSVLQNSDFRSGSRYWFFISDDHLVWRAKNCFLHLLVETGLLGLGVALTLCSWVLSKCFYTAFVRRSWPACVTFTSLMGFFSIGMFGTLIDTPGILLLVIMQLAMAHGLVVLTPR